MFIEPTVPDNADVTTVVIACFFIALITIITWHLIRKSLYQRERVATESPADDIFKLVSRVKRSVRVAEETVQPEEFKAAAHAKDGYEESPKTVDLLQNRENITASLRALAEKYSLSEITLATGDGLVLASSAGHDVQADAAQYSQIIKRQSAPDDPEVSLFEVKHRDKSLIGIVRMDNNLPQNWKKGIREDTKVILQWWL
jgi:hypothetical protein